jgi:hypothetical protein
VTLREALLQAKAHGGYVVYGNPPVWSEYSTQHVWDAKGNLHWTAGGTRGALVEQPWWLNERFRNQLDQPGFDVYPEWKHG